MDAARLEELNIVEKIQGLSDLELATLLCLVAGQHCIITTEEDALDELEQEIQLVGHIFTTARRHLTFSQIATSIYD